MKPTRFARKVTFKNRFYRNAFFAIKRYHVIFLANQRFSLVTSQVKDQGEVSQSRFFAPSSERNEKTIKASKAKKNISH